MREKPEFKDYDYVYFLRDYLQSFDIQDWLNVDDDDIFSAVDSDFKYEALNKDSWGSSSSDHFCHMPNNFASSFVAKTLSERKKLVDDAKIKLLKMWELI